MANAARHPKKKHPVSLSSCSRRAKSCEAWGQILDIKFYAEYLIFKM
jgi:hypothetical protein